MKRTLIGVSMLCIGAVTLSSCSSNEKSAGVSRATGWNYNDSRLGGFEVANYPGQQTGPGLAFVEGGRFTMGQVDEDLSYAHNNLPHTVSVSSFYMDETEVANIHYREYIYWLQRAYGADYVDAVSRALPDTNSWRRGLAYNEPMVEYYFRHAAYNYYPVVGVNWYQAMDFCQWRTDRVNEIILIRSGKLRKNPNQVNEDIFNTETYIASQYEGLGGWFKKRDLDPNGSGKRNVNYSDGILLPNYRLPTEAEWEYAALGLIANNPEPNTKRRRGEEVITDRNTYPWGPRDGVRSGLRNQYQGEFNANFQRGHGDAMGVAGGLNDNATYPSDVFTYKPNAWGLYNMAGNVSEWTMDTYRPQTFNDAEGVNPFRGNVFDAYRTIAEDNSLEEKDSMGKIPKRLITQDEIQKSHNADFLVKQADARDTRDGGDSLYFYDYGKTTLVNNEAKVIKGGSWADRAYWLAPGTRRFQNANQGSSTVGFRCVMDRLGSPDGNNSKRAGNIFSTRR